MDDLPLDGLRIVVTRPRDQADPLAAELERLGAIVAIVPLVEIRLPEDPRALELATKDLGRYDWLVLTSANAVRAIGERLRVAGGGERVAAVGPATAAALRAVGVEPAFVPDRFAAEEIAAGLGPLEGTTVLVVQADVADPALVDDLRERGATVVAAVGYRTVPVEPAMSGILPLRIADAVILTSGSAAASLASLARSLGDADPLLVCIGPKTAEAARNVGLRVGLVADEATSEGIIQALMSHFAEIQ